MDKQRYKGTVQYKLDSPFFEILEARVRLFYKGVEMTRNLLVIDSYTNNIFPTFLDILLFIKKYGELTDINVTFNGEFPTLSLYFLKLEEGEIVADKIMYGDSDFNKSYVFDELKEELISNDFVSFSNAINSSAETYDILEKLIETNDLKELQILLENKAIFDLYSKEHVYLFREEKIIVVKAIEVEKVSFTESSQKYLTAYDINLNEKRKIEVFGHSIPIHETFMKWLPFKSKPIIRTPDGELNSICSQCKHRLQREVFGEDCKTCEPVITNKGETI